MKKSLLIAGIIASVLTLGACSSNNDATQHEETETSKTEETAQNTQDNQSEKQSSDEQPVKVLDIDLEEIYKNKEMREYAEKFMNTKAPDFTLTNMNGEEVSLSDFKGQNVILEFVWTDCSYCQSVQPTVAEFKAKNNDVQVLQVFPYDDAEKIKSFLEQTNTTDKVNKDFILTNEKRNTVTKDYEILLTPTFMFIDKNGFITYVHLGALSNEVLESLTKLSFE